MNEGSPIIETRDEIFFRDIPSKDVSEVFLLAHVGKKFFQFFEIYLFRIRAHHGSVLPKITLMLRHPRSEGLERNQASFEIRERLTQLKKEGVPISLRFYDSPPFFRGAVVLYKGGKRASFLAHYYWSSAGTTKGSRTGLFIWDDVKKPNHMVAELLTWMEHFRGKNEIHTVVFDFDNTLVDSDSLQIETWYLTIGEGIAQSILELQNLHSELIPHFSRGTENKTEALKKIEEVFIRQGQAEKITEELFVHLDENKNRELIKIRSKIRAQKTMEAFLFPGVRDCLAKISKSYSLAIISFTDEQIIKAYLKENGLQQYFTGILGKRDPLAFTPLRKRLPKSALLLKMSQILGIPLARMVYVGDSIRDYDSAAQLHVPFVLADIQNRGTSQKKGDWQKFFPGSIGRLDSYLGSSLEKVLVRHSLELEKQRLDAVQI